jgi:leader peptidase (prepilin peptidase) / N-methyltransferase
MLYQFGALVPLVIAILGMSLGSFLHASAWRLTYEISLLKPSSCTSCNTTLSWPDLIPVLSWIFQKGICRYCLQPIGIMYLTAEVFFGMILTVLWWQLGLTSLFFCYSLFSALLFFIFFTDYFGLIIFRHISVGLLLFGGLFSYLRLIPVSFDESVLAAALSYTFLQTIRLTFRWVRGIEGMGSGDPEILAGIAAWVGVLPVLHITTGAAMAKKFSLSCPSAVF